QEMTRGAPWAEPMLGPLFDRAGWGASPAREWAVGLASALAVVVLAWALARLIVPLIARGLARLARRTETQIDDEVVAISAGPLRRRAPPFRAGGDVAGRDPRRRRDRDRPRVEGDARQHDRRVHDPRRPAVSPGRSDQARVGGNRRRARRGHALDAPPARRRQ